jgi:hypothetical protein
MLKKILSITILSLLFSILYCTPDSRHIADNNSFKAATLRKKIIVFNNVESGIVSITPDNYKKMALIGKDGNPVYTSSELAGRFTKTSSGSIKNYSGICIRFTIPRIEQGDYCIINAVVHFPKDIRIGGQKSSTVDSDYRYESRNSGKTEYIWFLFDKNNPDIKIPGRWEMTLKNGDIEILKRNFTLTQ